MSMIGGTNIDAEDSEMIIEDDDPFESIHRDLKKGLKDIRQSFSHIGQFRSSNVDKSAFY
jgi:hypothetical protein